MEINNFYCIAREDGKVPCEEQCPSCAKMNQHIGDQFKEDRDDIS